MEACQLSGIEERPIILTNYMNLLCKYWIIVNLIKWQKQDGVLPQRARGARHLGNSCHIRKVSWWASATGLWEIHRIENFLRENINKRKIVIVCTKYKSPHLSEKIDFSCIKFQFIIKWVYFILFWYCLLHRPILFYRFVFFTLHYGDFSYSVLISLSSVIQ